MQIDWFTAFAQAVNFFILVWLLKRFLYNPIVKNMDAREQAIADRLTDAAAEKKDAIALKESYEEKQDALSAEKASILGEARDEAETLRKTLITEARDDVSALKKSWEDDLKGERDALRGDLRRQALDEFNKLASKVFKDLANAGLEQQMVAVFVDRLSALSKKEKDGLKQALESGDKPEVSTAFALAAADKKAVTEAVKAAVGKKTLTVDFKKSATVSCGVELDIGGQSVVWTIDGYLDALERKIDTALMELSLSASL